MEAIVTYLESLQNRIFKLLPMREAYDSGCENCLEDYLDNLHSNILGAILTFNELSSVKYVVEVCNNVAFLKENMQTPFKKWRSIILRSTRLIGDVIDRYVTEA